MFNQFPIVSQHDAMQCGIACLQMICRYYGRIYDTETMSQYCHATTEGVSMLGISQAANALGLETVSAKLSVEKMMAAPLPCILHWNQNHFVVLYRIKKGRKFYVADPGKGLIVYSVEEFLRGWLSSTEKGEEVALKAY